MKFLSLSNFSLFYFAKFSIYSLDLSLSPFSSLMTSSIIAPLSTTMVSDDLWLPTPRPLLLAEVRRKLWLAHPTKFLAKFALGVGCEVLTKNNLYSFVVKLKLGIRGLNLNVLGGLIVVGRAFDHVDFWFWMEYLGDQCGFGFGGRKKRRRWARFFFFQALKDLGF